jgi:SNF2 family DNA or RNA helicase
MTDYQRAGLAASLGWYDESGMFVWSAGSGKTLGSIAWALAAGGVTVAVTKPAVRNQWAREVERFTTADVDVLEGTTIGEFRPRSSPCFLVTGYSTLPVWTPTLEKLRPTSVIFDESHLVQSHRRWDAEVGEGDKPRFSLKGNISASAYRLSRCARRRLATTATPIRDRVRNLWAQLDLVRPWEFGTFSAFTRRYCAAMENPYGGIDTRGQSNLDELKSRLALVSHSVKYSEANRALPPKRRQVTYVKVSEQVRADAIGEDLRRAARNGPTALLEMRLMEAASRKRNVIVEHVMDAIAGGLKVCVFTGRRRDVEELERKIRVRFAHPNFTHGPHASPLLAGHGGMSVEERDRLAQQYMDSPGPALLIGTGDSFGEGLNLQDTDVGIQAMLPYTPGAIIQREGRWARLGQKRPVLIHYFVAEGTVDEHVAAILLNKIPAVERALDLDEVRGLGRELIGASEEELLASLLEKVIGKGDAPHAA